MIETPWNTTSLRRHRGAMPRRPGRAEPVATGAAGEPFRRRAAHALCAVAVLILLLVTGACANGNEGSGQIAAADVPAFDADSAHALLRRQVEFGPRVPGTPGHAEQLQWMVEYLRERADSVIVQSFDQPIEGAEPLRLHNVFARFAPENPTRILLAAHWDTRPVSDQEDDEARQQLPVAGANDGASGVAVLLALADMFAAQPPPIGVDILLTDGEDFATEPGDYDNMYLGAKYFAANQPAGYAPLYGILVDLVGDTNPRFEMEGYSLQYAPEVVQRVWRMAEGIGYGNIFVRSSGMSVMDDHVPLNQGGIRTIDIIDMDYGPNNAYWHSQNDVVENTSSRGLGAVGDVIAALIYRGG
ncbi:MAG TPA: M28 family peptidase [Longimicrobiales bacterium]|nr:M28 family peptidase [Longimicrobiales bacterium]